MSKRTDDTIDAIERTLTVEGPTGDVSKPTIPRTRRINATVDDAGHDTITTAAVLKLATMGIAGRISPELMGRALTCIAREWCQDESLRLQAKGGG